MSVVTLHAGAATLADLDGIYRSGSAVRLDRTARPAVEAAAGRVAKAANGAAAVYGVNTGFGKLAAIKIEPKDTAALQRNLILSHCAGVGDRTEVPVVRLMMVLKLLSLGRGALGRALVADRADRGHAGAGRHSRVPAQGSVGASGDLAPLAHMAR